MSSDVEAVLREDARLRLLEALKRWPDERAHTGLLQEDLVSYGIDRERTWVNEQLRYLSRMGAVVVTEAEGVLIAQLAEPGARHLRRASVIEGVRVPPRSGG